MAVQEPGEELLSVCMVLPAEPRVLGDLEPVKDSGKPFQQSEG